MTLFPVNPSTEGELLGRMQRIGLREADLEERFVRSQGPGGQNVNKVSSCVILVHRPTGIMVKCQEARSQGLNRFTARRILLDKLEARDRGEKAAARHKQEKIRRQKRRRSRRAKEKMLESKRRQSEKKARRRPVRDQD